jgi:hypothetical protein
MAGRRLRSKSVLLGLTVAAAATLTGCAAEEPDYQAICVNPEEQERVDDDQCDDDEDTNYHGSGGGFYWFYMSSRSSHPIPAIGSSYNPSHGRYDGKSLAKNNTVVRGGAPKSGASSVKSHTTSKMKSGGFGGKGGTVGG